MELNLSKKAISKLKTKPGMLFDDFIIEEIDHVEPVGKYFFRCRCVVCNYQKVFSSRRLNDNRPVLCREHRKYIEPDISGQVYGFIVVDSLSDEKTDDGYNIWNGHCVVCGKQIQKTYEKLKNTRGESCGCIRNQKNHDNEFIDMTGKTYNNVFVKSLFNNTPKKKDWLCECLVCGKEFVAEGASIRRGNTKSCGCTRFEKLRKQKFHDLSDQKFGAVLVESFAGYVNMRATWNCLCMLCNNRFVSTGHDLLAGDVQSCGCAISHMERMIADFLTKHHIDFERQKTFDGCKDKALLRFDFYIESRRCALEYDGQMHYIETSLGNDLEGQQRRDAIKTKYCEENDITLIRIPYWEKDNIESILTDWLLINSDEEANSSDAGLSA